MSKVKSFVLVRTNAEKCQVRYRNSKQKVCYELKCISEVWLKVRLFRVGTTESCLCSTRRD